MALSPAFLDELRARTPLHSIVARRVKLSRSGKNWSGCCPFHNEKSASFYVYEDGFHCFGCGAHGDAISFVMQTAGASFPEAVEQLAAEAGLEVPKPSPRAQEAEQQRLDLHGVLDAAQASFVRRLHAPEGSDGLAYLRGRGLADETIARFGLGWSGDGRGSLMAELRRAAIEPARMLEAGLLRETEDGSLRELYWGRVTFPIRDRRGRTISFGGRTLGDAKPKYINGPETPAFSKRRTLYALDLARAGIRADAKLVVAEGYMDVIAMHQAGFRGAVAPLGTALTEDQLEELWRLSPAPILCFDGDAAGGRAAARVAELCLPMLTPERTLLFAALPPGEDPDALLRTRGPAAMQTVLDTARPMADALYGILAEQGRGDQPEQRAALRTRLVAAAARIADKTLAAEYRGALLNRFFDARKPRGKKAAAPVAPRPARTEGVPDTQTERARCLIGILLRHPDLLRDTEEAFQKLDLPPPFERLRDEMLAVADHGTLDSEALLAHLKGSGSADTAAMVLSAHPMPLPACAHASAMPAEAEAGWWEIHDLMHRGSLWTEVEAARRDFAANPTEARQARLIALTTAHDNLTQQQMPD